MPPVPPLPEVPPGVVLRPIEPADHEPLLAVFARIVADDEGYPQDPTEPVDAESFAAYWLAPARAVWIAEVDGEVAGSWTMKPINVGRAAHVANAGYFLRRSARGKGLGRLLVVHSMHEALRLGFDALQFNFVFASNPARALYDDLGFTTIGEVPAVIDGEPVVIYHRLLT